jgi:hypothetical protein
MTPLTDQNVADINTLSHFLACPEVLSLQTCAAIDVVVICGSAILPIAESVFTALQFRPDLTKTLVICGGIGHSTNFLYDAVHNNCKYAGLRSQIEGLPEATVHELILRRHYPELAKRVDDGEIKLIIEDQSQNCGANAIQTRRVLELNGISSFRSCIVVQDPTMALRTLAAFQHTYLDMSPAPAFFSCPTFVPRVYLDSAGGAYIVADQFEPEASIDSASLWTPKRFFDLLMGEIPRLRDDANGYGPKGKGFIVHVDIDDDVETAWKRLRQTLEFKR